MAIHLHSQIKQPKGMKHEERLKEGNKEAKLSRRRKENIAEL
jgi:hypothetical protein